MKIKFALLAIAGINRGLGLDFGQWHPLVPGDVRSPYPALNSLANHCFLPHDDKSLSIPLVVKALTEALNVSVEVATISALGGLQTSSNLESGTFDLSDLNKHGLIEHDGSPSRQDASLGNNHNFSQGIFKEFLGYLEQSGQIVDGRFLLQAAAAARWGRIQRERQRDPKFMYRIPDKVNSYTESAIYWQVLNDPKTRVTPLQFVKVFFEEERLLYNEGWRTPQEVVHSFTLLANVLHMALATPEKGNVTGRIDANAFHG